MPKSSPKAPDTKLDPDAEPNAQTQDSSPQPEPVLRWIAIHHDAKGEIVAADLPDALGVLLHWEGHGLVVIPGADLVDNQIVKHAHRRSVEAFEAKRAVEEGPKIGPREAGDAVRAREMEHFEAHRDRYEHRNVDEDPANLPPQATASLRSPLAPALPPPPEAPAPSQNAFGNGGFRLEGPGR